MEQHSPGKRIASVYDELPRDGLVLVVKRDCPTCKLIEPVVDELQRSDLTWLACSQDDPTFPTTTATVLDDRELEVSYRLGIEIVPTLIRMQAGKACARAIGWNRNEWETVSGLAPLGATLPDNRPGCGSLTLEPGWPEELAVRYGESSTRARQIDVIAPGDAHEVCYDRGWSDGLPVIPPTEVRVLRMLAGTQRDGAEVLGRFAPSDAECTVEKVAINAVMAGCKPDFMPVVLAAVEAALEPELCTHGVLCTTDFAGPIVIVNGPWARRIGMNAGINVFGQGNRANATIGRALQLVIRNMGGGVPGGIDRATFGTPGKFTFCFAEDESDPQWQTLALERGYASDASTVTIFMGSGVQGVWERFARTAHELTRSLARSLAVVGSEKLAHSHSALLALAPDHYALYRAAGWSKQDILSAFDEALMRPTAELTRGAQGIAEGLPGDFGETMVSKFRPGDLLLVRAGGPAGFMSAIMAGWWTDSTPVSKEIKS